MCAEGNDPQLLRRLWDIGAAGLKDSKLGWPGLQNPGSHYCISKMMRERRPRGDCWALLSSLLQGASSAHVAPAPGADVALGGAPPSSSSSSSNFCRACMHSIHGFSASSASLIDAKAPTHTCGTCSGTSTRRGCSGTRAEKAHKRDKAAGAVGHGVGDLHNRRKQHRSQQHVDVSVWLLHGISQPLQSLAHRRLRANITRCPGSGLQA